MLKLRHYILMLILILFTENGLSLAVIPDELVFMNIECKALQIDTDIPLVLGVYGEVTPSGNSGQWISISDYIVPKGKNNIEVCLVDDGEIQSSTARIYFLNSKGDKIHEVLVKIYPQINFDTILIVAIVIIIFLYLAKIILS